MKDAGYIKFVYKPTEEDIRRANLFSNGVDTTVEYGALRNQNNPETRIYQNMTGKLAEIAVSKWAAKPKAASIIQDVDWKIYPGGRKSFSPDIILYNTLTKTQLKFSVKCSPRKYGGYTEYIDGTPIPVKLEKQYTYTKQLSNNNGKGGTDRGEYDYYILCNWHDQKNVVEVYAYLRPSLFDIMTIRPFHQEFKGIKECVMMETCGQKDGVPLKEFPCGIDELIKRQNETKNHI